MCSEVIWWPVILVTFYKNPYRYYYYNKRQTREEFVTTSHNCRVIYDTDPGGVGRCRLRIFGEELQGRPFRHGRGILFIQRERNLGDDDVDTICELAVNFYRKHILCT